MPRISDVQPELPPLVRPADLTYTPFGVIHAYRTKTRYGVRIVLDVLADADSAHPEPWRGALMFRPTISGTGQRELILNHFALSTDPIYPCYMRQGAPSAEYSNPPWLLVDAERENCSRALLDQLDPEGAPVEPE